MILEIIKNIIISIIIITFFHYLYKYLLNEFTIKKTNNILYEEINEFKNINNILNNPNNNSNKNINNILNNPNNNSNKNNKNEEKITTETNLEENLKEYYNKINNIKD